MDTVAGKLQSYGLIAVLVSLIALPGCALSPSVDLSKPAAVTEATKLLVNPYRGHRILVGPTVDRVRQNRALYRLASSEESDTIYLEYYAPERGFLQSATDTDGRNLYLYGGYYTTTDPPQAVEISFLILPKGYLQGHIERGIHVRAYSDRGGIDLSVSPSYIQGYLQKKKQSFWPGERYSK